MIILTKPTVLQHELLGIADALASIHEDVVLWQPDIKPCFDAMQELKPDWLIIDQGNINEAVIAAIVEFNVNVIYVGLSYPQQIADNIKLLLIPHRVPEKICLNIEKPYFKLNTQANIVKFKGGVEDSTLQTDILYISNTNIYDRPYILEYLTSLHNMDVSVKICGNTRVPLAYYLGPISSLSELMALKASATIVLDFDGEALLDNAANKTFTLTNVQQDIFPWFSSLGGFSNKVELFLKEERIRRQKIKEAYLKVIDSRTYLHSLQGVGELLNNDWCERAKETFQMVRL